MASRGKKRGKTAVVETTEDKENVPSRRTGREKKKVDYCEESPVKKSAAKKKEPVGLEKQALQNARKNNTQTIVEQSVATKSKGKQKVNTNVSEVEEKTELKNEKDTNKRPGKQTKRVGKAEKKEKPGQNDKKKETEVEDVKESELDIDIDAQIYRQNTKEKPEKKQPKDRKKKGKTNKQEENDVDVTTQTKAPLINDETSSALTDTEVDEKQEDDQKAGKNNRKQKTRANNTYTLENDTPTTPVSSAKRNRKLQEDTPSSPSVRTSHRTPGKHTSTPSSPAVRHSSRTRTPLRHSSALHCNNNSIQSSSPCPETPTVPQTPKDIERPPVSQSESPQEAQTVGQTPGDIERSAVTPSCVHTTSERQTPSAVSGLQKTPSSASRVSQVIGNMRKESLSRSNTPRSGHCDCADRMTQVYEILELITDQLADLKSEMETVKSTNENLQGEVEQSRDEASKLREEVNNLKNTSQNQMTDVEDKQKKSVPLKSHVDQNEVDLLWHQCDVQKKTIRSLHCELDATKHQFNERFEKYKQAMVFILCKTRPDVKHSDVSKLRFLLNKTEQSLDLTLDEICSTMECDMSGINQSKSNKTVPVVKVHNAPPSNQNEASGEDPNDRRNGNVLRYDQQLTTPSKENPFQARPKIQRTPVSEKQCAN